MIEQFSDEILADSLQGEAEGKTFSYVLSGWLQKISPDVKFEPKLAKQADISYSLYDQHRSSNVGYGLSYSLPVIVALLLGTLNQDSLVLIENPEAHIHPRGQYEMSQLICLCVEAGAHVIVETHSDHLFDGIRIFAKKIKLLLLIRLLPIGVNLMKTNVRKLILVILREMVRLIIGRKECLTNF